VCKGGMLDSRCWQFSNTLAYFHCFSRFRLTWVPMSDLSKLGISGNLVMSTFPWHKSYVILSSSYETTGFGIRAAEEISLLAVRFLVLILGNSGMLLSSRKNLLLGKLFIFEKLLLSRNSWSGLRRLCVQKRLQNRSLYVQNT
jgi:hypothetical protein